MRLIGCQGDSCFSNPRLGEWRRKELEMPPLKSGCGLESPRPLGSRLGTHNPT
jgi:hypothetical protein